MPTLNCALASTGQFTHVRVKVNSLPSHFSPSDRGEPAFADSHSDWANASSTPGVYTAAGCVTFGTTVTDCSSRTIQSLVEFTYGGSEYTTRIVSLAV